MIERYSDFSLLPYNTFGIDVKATRFVEFESEEELCEIVSEGIVAPTLVMGGGSNLLFLNDFDGTVLHSKICGAEVVVESEENVFLRVGSGMKWDDLVKFTIEQGWQGLENLSAIPGEVGASAVQNIGAYGVEAGEFIERVDTIYLADGSKHCFSQSDCQFGYRDSIFKHEAKGLYVVTYVTYRLRKKPEYKVTYGNLRQRVEQLGGLSPANISQAVRETRALKLPDPAELGNAGSFFMNPVVERSLAAELLEKYPEMPQYKADGGIKLSAAWLIEQCGWKGKRVGNVGAYAHQALVLVTYGGATGQEIIELSDAISLAVKEKFSVQLHKEVNAISCEN